MSQPVKTSGVRLGVLVASLLTVVSCGEGGSLGAQIAIPEVLIQCSSSRCRSLSAPRAIVVFTLSGCDAAQFGAVRSGSTDSVSCSPGIGCSARVNSWVDRSGVATATMSSGVYSICATLDFDRGSVEPPEPGDSSARIDEASLASDAQTLTVGGWVDL